jgi:PhoH-like ATPase
MKKNLIFPDTNVLVTDTDSLENFLKENKVWLSLQTIIELDYLKNKSNISKAAIKVIGIIEKLQKAGGDDFKIIKGLNKTKLKNFYNDTDGDHKILATFAFVVNKIQKKKNNEIGKIKLVSRDRNFRILARELFSDIPNVFIEDYKKDVVKTDEILLKSIKIINNFDSPVIADGNKGSFLYDEGKYGKISLNEAVLCRATGSEDNFFSAVRRKDGLFVLNNKISASSIRPYSNGFGRNWPQFFALHYLLDPEIKAVFLVGGPGSGKTLLSLAAALEQKKRRKEDTSGYKYIRIARPPVFLGNKDHYGFIPGGMSSKMHLWNLPFIQSLDFIQNVLDQKKKGNKKDVTWDSTFGSADETFQDVPISYIQGNTFHDSLFILDEAQNLTIDEIKMIMTRMGMNSKIIFIGDPGQIQNPLLNSNNCGLMVAMNKMRNNPIVAHVVLKHLVRSELSKIANELL